MNLNSIHRRYSSRGRTSTEEARTASTEKAGTASAEEAGTTSAEDTVTGESEGQAWHLEGATEMPSSSRTLRTL